MLVFAQFEEGISGDCLSLLNPQSFDPDTDPMAALSLVLGVIVVLGKVLVEVGSGVPSVFVWDS